MAYTLRYGQAMGRRQEQPGNQSRAASAKGDRLLQTKSVWAPVRLGRRDLGPVRPREAQGAGPCHRGAFGTALPISMPPRPPLLTATAARRARGRNRSAKELLHSLRLSESPATAPIAGAEGRGAASAGAGSQTPKSCLQCPSGSAPPTVTEKLVTCWRGGGRKVATAGLGRGRWCGARGGGASRAAAKRVARAPMSSGRPTLGPARCRL